MKPATLVNESRSSRTRTGLAHGGTLLYSQPAGRQRKAGDQPRRCGLDSARGNRQDWNGPIAISYMKDGKNVEWGKLVIDQEFAQ
ncbi:hypothetical protein [Sinorhizobium meliloti]|uniref:hypothetical protein n=1 Tax=Rhizobium meliloti TaxID=382 RepID=UPI001F23DD9B|nr:hypothetical protein [Sinorhizobium meliloti]